MNKVITSLLALTATASIAHADVIVPKPRPEPRIDCEKVDPNDNVVQLACNIYHEAGNQASGGKLAVAIVTLNRLNHQKFPSSVFDVVWEKHYSSRHRRYIPQFSWTLDGKTDRVVDDRAWQDSVWIANLAWGSFQDPAFGVEVGDLKLETATHYHAEYIHPSWARKMKLIAQIGKHLFYCNPRISKCNDPERK